MNVPAPLTPADCDLQDFPFMPLQVARLRDSDLAAEAHPEACWYAVLLWSASWHQLPAGSLPDNETVLARLCGLGRDLKTFRKHRDDAMRGFVLCSDGRLYHPVVAEQVREAWESKRQQRWRSECARVKKHNQRHGTELPVPTFDEFIGGPVPAVSPGTPEPVPRDTAQSPPGHSLQETETGTGTGISEERANALVVADASTTPKARREYPEQFETVWKTYPHVEGRSSKPNALAAWRKLPDDERAALIGAVERFRPKVAEVCGDRGAPCMARWLKDGKHLNYLGPAASDVSPERWRTLVQLWRDGHAWPAELGPAPDQPETQVPTSALTSNVHHLAGEAA